MTWSTGPTQVLTNNSLTQYLFMFGTILKPIFLIWPICVLLLIRDSNNTEFLKTGVRVMKEYRSFVHKVLVEWSFINKERLTKILCDRLSYNLEQVLQATVVSKRGAINLSCQLA